MENNDLKKNLIIVRGSGDIATGIIWMLFNAGFNVCATDIEKPTTIRRTVSFSESIYDGQCIVEGTKAVLCKNIEDIHKTLNNRQVAIIIDENLDIIKKLNPDVVIDAIISKKNIGTTIDMAKLVIGVGPGFVAKKDVDFVIETMRGHDLGRIIEKGSAMPNTGVPGEVANHSLDRVIHASCSGKIHVVEDISSIVNEGDVIAYIGENKVNATMSGIIRGMIKDGFEVNAGLKIADIDPRITEIKNCYTISDKARTIGGSVLLLVVKELLKNGF